MEGGREREKGGLRWREGEGRESKVGKKLTRMDKVEDQIEILCG